MGVDAINMEHLRQVIANIANGGKHTMYFWQDIANMPPWWPSKKRPIPGMHLFI